jgi:hypothetical protein
MLSPFRAMLLLVFEPPGRCLGPPGRCPGLACDRPFRGDIHDAPALPRRPKRGINKSAQGVALDLFPHGHEVRAVALGAAQRDKRIDT